MQLKKTIIPAFNAAHSPSYQALIMVDHSQGHPDYAPNALLTSWMNLWPGGKQACLWDEWYMFGNEKIIQSMTFPANHPTYPNKLKEMKAVLEYLWSAIPMTQWQHIAVPSTSLISSLILWHKHLLSKRWSCQLGTSASSCQSSTVNLISLNYFGVQSRSTCKTTAITHFPVFKKICQLPLFLFKFPQSRSGNTGWFDGCRHMGLAWAQKQLNLKSRSSAPWSINLIDILLNSWYTFWHTCTDIDLISLIISYIT